MRTMRPLQGMTPPMTKAADAPGRRWARGAAVAALIAAAALPVASEAQGQRAGRTRAHPSRPAAPPAPAAPAAAAPAAAPAEGPRPLSESVAAVVNDEIISTYDLAQRMRLLIATSGVQPTAETLPQFQREALISLVDEHLQLHELRRVEKTQKMSIIASDDDIREEVGQMARGNNMSTAAFLAAIKAQGISQDTLFQQLRAQISWQRWIQGRYGSRLRIGDDQVKATETMLAASASKPQYQIGEVLIDAARVGGMQNALQGAQQLVTQMQQGAPFAAVARQFSSAATAASGGDVGWVSPGEMPAEVDAALEQLRPGQLSAPIPVRDGVYIIYLRDKRSGAGATLVNLKQAAVSLPATATEADIAAARAKLQSVRAAAKGCDDLGEAEIADLAPEFRQAAQTLAVGQVSEPIRTKVGLHLVAVCGKRASGGAQLTRDDIENRLYGQQLAMIARRYMRDLRNSATIETR
jgi:peptidyl-prolyl cis-trans isomerase SurA